MSNLAPVPIAGVFQAPGTAGMSVAFKICLRKVRG